ncbi:amidohydrolase family protein [Streptosporangium sp. NPDC020145]|uniref:amidohydrolase family protein n=1 Tax=Streptosporangium sp. NPDC020145 TaxID=3154694 RepID=UPI0034220800
MTGQPTDEPVVDAHVNLATDLAVPRRFLEEQAANVHHRLVSHGQPVKLGRVTDRLLALYQDHDGDRLVAEMDAAGVDQAFLVAPDFSHVADGILSPPELAELHHKVSQRHPGRFRVFWGVDPRSGPDGIALFERCLDEYGFAGLKLYPPAGYSPSDRRLYPYYEVCAHRGVPVLSHTGPGWGPLDFTHGQPLMIDEAARDFPGVNFILGHGGVTHVEESTYLCLHRPNVFLDISQFPGVLSSDGWQAHLNRLFHLGVNHKILFGTCWPSFRMSVSLDSLTREFREGTTVFAGVRRSHRRLIMAGTIRRLAGDDGAVAAAERSA